MEWFEKNEAEKIIVFAGVSNEEILEFYKTFGLLPPAIRLELDPSDRCLVYFSVLRNLFGRFRDQQTLRKGKPGFFSQSRCRSLEGYAPS
jgi:hypothetical protein